MIPNSGWLALRVADRYVLLPGLLGSDERRDMLAEAEGISLVHWRRIFNRERPLAAQAAHQFECIPPVAAPDLPSIGTEESHKGMRGAACT